MTVCRISKENRNAGKELYRDANELNDPEAQFILGWMYCNGGSLAINSEKGVAWCRKAANQGHRKSLCELGYMYYMGELVEQCDTKALELFSAAASLGDDKAIYNLGSSGLSVLLINFF